MAHLTWEQYHLQSLQAGDVDPGNELLRYVANRFELNPEQRAWLAFLFSLSYCAPTAFYIYNEFPDMETVDVGRLKRWWLSNKAKLLFQTDRRRVQTMDYLVPIYQSYVAGLRGDTQLETFRRVLSGHDDPVTRYLRLSNWFLERWYTGRFTLFLWADALQTVLPEMQLEPPDFLGGDATSSLNGVAYASGLLHLLHGGGLARAKEAVPRTTITKQATRALMAWASDARLKLKAEHPQFAHNWWQLETTFCAYKKYRRDNTRWVGYYLDRQAKEIVDMTRLQQHGVCWEVLWDYRKETYSKEVLWECRARS